MTDILEQSVEARILGSGLDKESLDYFLREAGNPKAQSILSVEEIEAEGIEVSDALIEASISDASIKCLKNGEFALVVLNGGMATRFGGVAKGTVEISDGISFLGAKLMDALRVSRRYDAPPPFIFLMCSSATNEPTRRHLEAHKFFDYPNEKIILFNQCESVRFLPNGHLFRDGHGSPSYHGTGHGDLPYCLRNVPEFRRFCTNGRCLLLSNVDNVLATADPILLAAFLAARERIAVEVVDKNPGDVGGGPLMVGGHAQLVEAFRLPDGFDHTRVPVFNTNTFWLDPQVILDETIRLPWHRVQKRVDAQPVIQFERLVGELTAGVSTRFIRVDRVGINSRFLAVKTPHDLTENRAIMMSTWSGRAP